VLAATNRDLTAAVRDGVFRADLFYRLNVVPIQVPALRDRRGDIRLLVEYFVERYAQKAGKRIRSISKETLDLFEAYHWPGNIRELQNVIERAVILSDADVFRADPSWLTPAPADGVVPTGSLTADLAQREKSDHRGRAARCPRCHQRCDRCRGKTGPTETDSRITDEEARHRPISFQDLIAFPTQKDLELYAEVSANAEAPALGQRGNPRSLQKFPSGARFATPARHASQAEHRVRPRDLGRRLVLQQGDPYASGGGTRGYRCPIRSRHTRRRRRGSEAHAGAGQQPGHSRRPLVRRSRYHSGGNR
jgi:hypothetical protein